MPYCDEEKTNGLIFQWNEVANMAGECINESDTLIINMSVGWYRVN